MIRLLREEFAASADHCCVFDMVNHKRNKCSKRFRCRNRHSSLAHGMVERAPLPPGAFKSSIGLDNEDRCGLQRLPGGFRTCLSTDTVDNMSRENRRAHRSSHGAALFPGAQKCSSQDRIQPLNHIQLP